MKATMTIVGRLTKDPELKYTPNGEAVCSFTVAHSDRKYDKATGQWSDDGEPLFLPVTVWSKLAEGAAEQLTKGDAVVVVGALRSRSWEKDGQKHSRIEMTAQEVGFSVRSRRVEPQLQEAVAPW